MRKILLLMGVCVLAACRPSEPNPEQSDQTPTDQTFYGEKITTENALPADELLASLEGKKETNTKVKASIIETCAKKGCWMTVDLGNGEDMMVRFKDYGFFVPTEGAEGKTAVFEGKAYWDTLSVDDLRHYAEDAGKSKAEIEAITEPKAALAFEANGVIISEGSDD